MAGIAQVISSDSASGAQVIGGSLQFDNSKTTNLSRTPSSEGNRKTWTWSGWFNRQNIDANDNIFTVPGSSSKATQFTIMIHNGNYVSIDYGGAFYLKTNRLIRDISGWYHFVVTVDTTLSTADNRIRLYINGVEETSFDTRNNPDQDEELGVNRTSAHTISSGDSSGFDGLLSNFYLIDGQALGPENFGFTDPLTNTWRPKKFGGAYTIDASGTMYSTFSGGDFNGSNTAAKAFDGSTSTKAEPHDNDTVYFDFTHVNSTGTLKNYNGNSRLPTYLNQGGLTAADGLRTNPILNAFDGDSSTYCDMTYANGQYSRLTFEHPITNVTNITIGYDGEGDPGYNGANHQTSVSFNGSRQTITLYSGGAITLNNLDFISQPGSGVCRLYDITITTSSVSATELTFDGGVTASSSLRMYLNKAGSPGASHFIVNGDDSGGSAIQSQLGGSVPSGDWLTISSIAKLKQVSLFHQSGSSSVELFAVEVDGTVLVDGNEAEGANSFYLPMDGDSKIEEDKSGQGNNWQPSNLGGSVELDKATGARPILNTIQGGSGAGLGVFGSRENKYYTVTTANGGVYQFDITSGDNPSLSFIRGATYKFDYSSHTGHPVLFSSTNPSSSTTAYTDGTSIASNIISFTVPHNAPDTLYYYCQNHPTEMNGTISVTTDETKADPYAWKCVLANPFVGSIIDVSDQINCTTTEKAMTNVGSAVASTNGNFYNGSWNFDYSDDQITTPDSTDFTFGSGEFTMECWFYQTGQASWNYLMGQYGATYNTFYALNSNKLYCYFYHDSTSFILNDPGTLEPNQWVHTAVTRDSSNKFRLFINGREVASSTQSVTLLDAGVDFSIGSDSQSNYHFQGQIQDVRVYKGVAKYTSDFVVASTSPDILPDTPSGVSGKSELTKITDGAVSFDGSNDYLSIADSADFDMGTGDFTLECFVNSIDDSDYQGVFGSGEYHNNALLMQIAATGVLRFTQPSGIDEWGSTDLQNSGWHHIVMCRSGTTLKGFVDGREEISVAYSSNLDWGHSNNNVVIGVTDRTNYPGQYEFKGHISNLRLVKGTALYTKNFTPPTAPLTNVTNTKLLCCQSNTQAGAAAVSPNLGGINDGTVWSDFLSSAAAFGSTHKRVRAFDGDISTMAGTASNTGYSVTGNDDNALEFIPSLSIPFSSSVKVRGRNTGATTMGVKIDTGSGYGSEIALGSDNLQTVVSGSGNLVKIKVYTKTYSGENELGGIAIDDVYLTDPITVYGDAEATTFNPFNTDINTVRGQETGYATMNPIGKTQSEYFVQDGNLTCGNSDVPSGSSGSRGYVPSSFGMKTGKWYAECVTTRASDGDVDFAIGIFPRDASGYYSTSGCYACRPDAKLFSPSGTNVSYGTAWADGDCIGMKVDLDSVTKTIQWFKNNIATGDPVTISENHEFFFGYGSDGGGGGRTYTAKWNFGQKPFKFSPPDGFQALTLASTLPETVIANPDKYVDAVLYTGDNTASKQIDDLSFSPDLVWVKDRNLNFTHFWNDTVRGAGKILQSNAQTAQTDNADTIAAFPSFGSNGFTVGSNVNWQMNGNSEPYVGWCWKAGGSSNTFNVDDVGYASASDVGMNVGGQNSNAYNTTETWSTASDADSKAFDGSKAYDSGAVRLYGNTTLHTAIDAATTFTNVTSVTVGVSENSGNVTIDGIEYTTTYTSAIGLTLTNPPSTVKKIEVFGRSTGLQISYVMINGVILVDNGVTPADNIPSIATTGCSVGTKQGFSIIKFTNTTSDSTQSHGLTQKPDFIIWKKTNGTSHWPIYHSSLGATKYLYLNLTNAASTGSEFWNNTEPTNSYVTTKGEPHSMGSAGDTIMYLWHNVPGLQKFGSYTGVNSADGPYLDFGFRPAILMLKNISSGSTEWVILDNKRNGFNGTGGNNILFPSSAAIENATQYGDFLSNGWKFRINSSYVNSTDTFIYAAWAEQPSVNLYGAQSNAR